jgi:hypothetical protein
MYRDDRGSKSNTAVVDVDSVDELFVIDESSRAHATRSVEKIVERVDGTAIADAFESVVVAGGTAHARDHGTLLERRNTPGRSRTVRV